MPVGVDKFHQVVAGVVDIGSATAIGCRFADHPAQLVVVVGGGVAHRVGDRNPVAVYIVGEAGGAGLLAGMSRLTPYLPTLYLPTKAPK
jgi:hypothetical protein